MKPNDPIRESLDDLLPIPELVAKYPHIGSVSSLRDRVFHALSNGLDDAGAVVRVGRRVYISVPRFTNWMLSSRDTTSSTGDAQ